MSEYDKMIFMLEREYERLAEEDAQQREEYDDYSPSMSSLQQEEMHKINLEELF
jgi:hypothetical protein